MTARVHEWISAICTRVARATLTLAVVLFLAVIARQSARAQAFADTSWNETVLYTFTGGADGADPVAGLVRDAKGNLYGTTERGGHNSNTCKAARRDKHEGPPCGVVFEVDASGNQTVLHRFTGGKDGGVPVAGLILDAKGNLYGTTYFGGGNGQICFDDTTVGCGVVFKLGASGKQNTLYTFTGGADGANPAAGVIRDAKGNLYGTTPNGGAHLGGLVFKVDAKGHETVLYNFDGGLYGGNPAAGVIRDAKGNLYGTTPYGGGLGRSGIVFKLNAKGQVTVRPCCTASLAEQTGRIP